MKKVGATNFPNHANIFPGEQKAVDEVLEIAGQFGYGNIMAHVATAWAVHLVRQGLSRKAAIEAVSNRTPYPLPMKIKTKKPISPAQPH